MNDEQSEFPNYVRIFFSEIQEKLVTIFSYWYL